MSLPITNQENNGIEKEHIDAVIGMIFSGESQYQLLLSYFTSNFVDEELAIQFLGMVFDQSVE